MTSTRHKAEAPLDITRYHRHSPDPGESESSTEQRGRPLLALTAITPPQVLAYHTTLMSPNQDYCPPSSPCSFGHTLKPSLLLGYLEGCQHCTTINPIQSVIKLRGMSLVRCGETITVATPHQQQPGALPASAKVERTRPKTAMSGQSWGFAGLEPLCW